MFKYSAYYSDDSTVVVHMGAKDNEVKLSFAPLTVGPSVIVVSGRPGSGKDTQCQILADEERYEHLSTGNMFRKAIELKTPLGEKVASYVEKGELVPDDIASEVVLTFITEAHSRGKKVLLNGYPRTAFQAHKLREFANVTCFILLEVSVDVCCKRIANRLVDSVTGLVYTNESGVNPAPLNIRQNLQIRKDDNMVEKVAKRVSFYDTIFGHILFYFDDILQVVNGDRNINKVSTLINSALDNLHLGQNSFCGCLYRVANQVNIPCGHRTYCDDCIKEKAQLRGSLQAICPCCQEDVIRYISIQRQIWNKEEKYDSVSLSHTLCTQYANETITIAISVNVKDLLERLPVNICCVIDVSGSMGESAYYEDSQGNMVPTGYSVLEAVKNALRTLIGCLTPQDSFCLVTFSNVACVIFPTAKMTEESKSIVNICVNNMQATYDTNIWSGLELGLEAIKSMTGHKSLMLLTDGIPSTGYNFRTSLFSDYLASNNLSQFQLHTFGFGSSLKRGLLLELAEMGGGNYFFLPDASTAGPCFMKAIAHIGTVALQNVKLQLKAKNGATIEGNIRGIYPLDIKGGNRGERIITLHSLHFGQSREIVVTVDVPTNKFSLTKGAIVFNKNYLEAYLTHEGSILAHLECDTALSSSGGELSFARVTMVNSLTAALCVDSSLALPIIDQLIAKLDSYKDNSYIEMLAKDIKGRIRKGFLPGKYDLWGHHYNSAFVRAHQLQVSINDMDSSLSHYGGTLAKAFINSGKKVYTEVNKKIVTVAPRAIYVPTSSYTATFGGGGGGCFGGQCTVILFPSRKIKVSEVKTGDMLQTKNGYSLVQVVAQIQIITEVVFLFDTGLTITPTHPIMINDKWVKPTFLPHKKTTTSEVYNFVLSGNPCLLVNSVPCITWGHNLPELKHNFYDSKLFILIKLY